jgi:hypothetical protein
MSIIIASQPARARRGSLPQYVRKFRLEASEFHQSSTASKKLVPSHTPALIWTKVLVMSLASTGLLYLTVLMMN